MARNYQFVTAWTATMAEVQYFDSKNIFSIIHNHLWYKRPDIVNRVFRMKLNMLLDDLLKNDILGRVKNHIQVIEFQKVD